MLSSNSSPQAHSIVIVEDDAALRDVLSRSLGSWSGSPGPYVTHAVSTARAVELLQCLAVVDMALVDCDQPPSAQAPIFQELARWPAAICVLMSANTQKIEQLRALGIFAPLVLDKPVQQDALAALRSAALELASVSDASTSEASTSEASTSEAPAPEAPALEAPDSELSMSEPLRRS
jgi:CheY-like chemotaxis protein